jgi:hypothetical protein
MSVARARFAEHQPLHQLHEAHVALRAEIGLGLLRLVEDQLGGLHRAKDRRVPHRILVDADAESILCGPRSALTSR